MAVISEADAISRLNREDNLINFLRLHGQGRKKGDENKDGRLRLLAGVLANVGLEKQKDIAANLGISDSQVSHYKNGRNGVGLPNEELKSSLEDNLGSAKKSAVDILMGSLETITSDKISALKVRDASNLAKDMSVIVKNTTKDEGIGPKFQFIIHAPRVKDEKEFDIIEVERK